MGNAKQIMCALSFKQQSEYGTALADTDIDVALPFTGDDFLKEKYEKKGDEDVQKGHEWPEADSVGLFCDVTGSRKMDGESAGIGWVAAMAAGDCTSALVSGATSAYQHDIVPMDPKISTQLPVVTLIEDQVEFLKMYRDICIPEFSISGQKKKQLEVSIPQLIGSGYWETSTKTMPVLAPCSYLRCGSVKFERGVTDLSVGLKSFQFDWKTNIKADDGYVFGGPYLIITEQTKTLYYLCRSQLKFKDRTFALKFKMEYNDTIYKEMQAGVMKPITITCEGDEIETGINHQLIIFLPACEIQKADIVIDDGEQCLDCEVKIKYSRTDGFPVKITVINNIPAYLALPV